MTTTASARPASRSGIPAVPAGVRLATIADVASLRRFSQVLVFDAAFKTTRTARIRGYTGEAMCLGVADEEPLRLWLVDDDLDQLASTAHVTDGRFWLLVVTS